MTLEQGTLGYAWEFERKSMLDNRGEEPLELLAKFKDVLPRLAIDSDPTGVYDVRDQGRQGSCQGQALAGIFGACFWLHTGRKIKFSAAAGYYLSQKRDGIVGDRGSTLSGGQWVATQHGMCIEDDWPYPQQYNNREPENCNFSYKLAVTKPFSRTQDLLAWIDLGLPVQIGVMWGDSCDREIVSNWQPAGGGHSTFFWFRSKSGNVRNINSWGKRWNGDGVHEWTEASIDRAIKHRYSTFIGYGPAEMIHPTPEPI